MIPSCSSARRPILSSTKGGSWHRQGGVGCSLSCTVAVGFPHPSVCHALQYLAASEEGMQALPTPKWVVSTHASRILTSCQPHHPPRVHCLLLPCAGDAGHEGRAGDGPDTGARQPGDRWVGAMRVGPGAAWWSCLPVGGWGRLGRDSAQSWDGDQPHAPDPAGAGRQPSPSRARRCCCRSLRVVVKLLPFSSRHPEHGACTTLHACLLLQGTLPRRCGIWNTAWRCRSGWERRAVMPTRALCAVLCHLPALHASACCCRSLLVCLLLVVLLAAADPDALQGQPPQLLAINCCSHQAPACLCSASPAGMERWATS